MRDIASRSAPPADFKDNHSLNGSMREPKSRPGSDDADLASHVAEIALGNSEALAALYEATVARISMIARIVLGCPRDAEEVVGDVFVYVWQNSHRYDATRGAVTGWLAIVTRNRAIDRIRRRRYTVSLDADSACAVARLLTSDAESPDHFLARLQETSLIYRVLALQSPLKRRLIELAFLRGICHEEIAVTTGLPLGTIKSHIRRTLKSMRVALETTGHSDRASVIR